VTTKAVILQRNLWSKPSNMGSTSISNALIRRKVDNSLITASPYKSERVLDKAISAVGSAVGEKMDYIARKIGWGPTKTAERILDILGQGEGARALALERLYLFFKEKGFCKKHELSNLEMECVTLMKYALP
jgi:hypothetical protein